MQGFAIYGWIVLTIAASACSDAQSYRGQTPTGTKGPANGERGSTDNDPVTEPPTEADQVTKNPATSPAVTPPPATPVLVRSSKGSGGPAGLVEVPFTDSTGLASSYKINAPADAASKVYGLHIHLHGDGGGGYTDFPNKEARFDLIGVTVKAPNTSLTWGRTVGKQHALYLNELIQNDLLKKYNVDLDKIYFSTVSGGSYFFTGSFLPEFGQLYQSAALVMCGAETPRVAFTSPDVLGKFRVHWEVTAGERADIMTSVRASIDAYKTASNTAGISAAQQAKLQTVNIQGAGGHCEFDGVSYTTGIQQAIDTKFKAILPP